MSADKDGLPMSASERLMDVIRRSGLHPVTWLIVIAAIAHFAGDIVESVNDLLKFRALGYTPGAREPNAAMVAAVIVHRLAYSTLFIGSAATVELLARIWAELSALRTRARS